MKTNFKTLPVLLGVALISILQGCNKDDALNPDRDQLSTPGQLKKSGDDKHTYYGPAVPVGQGVMRAWVKVNKEGAPTAVGLNLSEKALENLPADPRQYVVYFPRYKGKNFYKHMLVDWNPQGHEPPGVYDTPHFDFHFYIIPNAKRLAIGPNDTVQFANAPALKYVPPVYLQTPGGVPQMGAHWVDLMSPEFNGGTFTKTFIWGSYDGRFIFWEPMITLAYLQTHPDDLIDLRQPEAFQRDGWYPEKYKISYSRNHIERENEGEREGEGERERERVKEHQNVFTIALLNLTYHSGE